MAGRILIGESTAAPATPPTGFAEIYVKSDGLWYTKDDAGNETSLVGATGATGATGSTGATGATGATGTAATIAVGTTTTLAAGLDATVTNVGTSSAAVFDFGVPRGADGAGTVSSVSVTTANGVSGSVATATTTPAISLTLGAITPTSVAVQGTAGAGYITLPGQSSNPTPPAAGTLLLHSNTVNGFTRMEQDNEATTNLVFGRDNVFIAKNESGVTINKGQVVYTSGTVSGVPQITKARANSAGTLPAVGVAMDSITHGSFGQVMYAGVLSFDTTAFSDGNQVWVSTATAGALQSTRPSGTTNFVQRMGTILVSGIAGTGLMLVQTAPAILNQETGTNATTWTGTNISYGGQLTSTVADGTAPLVVTSTTQVANLNVATAGTAGSATYAGAVTVAADATAATFYPLFVSATTGNLAPKLDADLTYNPSTNTLTATTFSGALTGVASGNALLAASISDGDTTHAPDGNSVFDALALKAPLASPTFSGNVTVVETTDTVYDITDGAAFEIDPANGNIQTVTLGASRTPAATNFAAGQCMLLGIDDGTAYTITWTTVAPTWVKAGGTATAPTLATTGYTWVLLWKVGTTIYGCEVGKP